jgi:CubicO group peptidase (beta-lactamase class C family)
MRFVSRILTLAGSLCLFGLAQAAPTAPAATAAAATSPPAAASPQLTRADVEAWLDGFVPNAIDSADVAGAVVVVVKDGQILASKGYGYADVATKKPVDPKTTLFRPGSVSKLFTWTAVMQMVEAGKLDLDTDVNTYLDFKLPARADGPITLRHIMTHTPGFEEQIKELIVSDPKYLKPLARYAREATPQRIYKAGSTPAYSNYATALAGYLVERVSGESFDDYVDHHIFDVLGMKYASFRQPLPAQLAPFSSSGYALGSQPSKPFEVVVAAPAGSLSASGEDMAQFMIAHLADGEFGGQRILKAETAQMMHSTPTDMIPPLNRMELGFYEQDYNGHRIISHGGDTQFFHSYLHLLLNDHVGFFVSVNSAGRPGEGLRGPLFESFMNRYFPAPHELKPLDEATAKAHAALVAGAYENSRRPETNFFSIVGLLGVVKIENNGDGTITLPMLKGANQAPRRYVEIAPFVWRDPVTWNRMAAKVENGRVVRISADEISPFMVLEPAPAHRSMRWLMPAVMAAAGVVFGTALLWPIAAISRRRHGVTLAVRGEALKAHLVSRIAAVAIAVVSASWLGLISWGSASLGFNSSMDWMLTLLQGLSALVYWGGALALVWSARAAFAHQRPLLARLWSVALAASGVVFLWVAYTYHLMHFTTRY